MTGRAEAAEQAGAVQRPGPRLRVEPRQTRGQARIAAVLDAAERLLGRVDVDAVTTTRIAAEAQVAVGSVYRYFPDKEAIFDALAARYLAEFEALMDQLTEHAAEEKWGDPVGVLVDAYADHYRNRPALRAIWFGAGLSKTLFEADRRHKRTMAAGIARLLVTLGVTEDAERVATPSYAGMLAADALIQEAFRSDPAGDAELLEAAKVLLRAYLTALVVPPT